MCGTVLRGLVVSITCMSLVAAGAVADEPFDGTFRGEKLSVEIAPGGPGHVGTIHLGQQQFPFKAREQGGALRGTFTTRSGDFDFTAKLKGRPVKGFVSTKVGDTGASVAVAYCRSDAPTTDWLKLMSAAGASGGGADIKLSDYRFPDGTGSIGLADGWKTNAQTCIKGILIHGPADQEVIIGLSLSVVSPDAWIVQNQRQMEMNARRMGLPPPPPLQLLIAPFTDPAEALANLTPQISRAGQRTGGPAVHLDKIVDQQKAAPMIPNANAALLTYDVTRTSRGTEQHVRAVAQIETIPVGPGTWMLYAIEGDAPRETFDRDLPIMLAMVKSLKTNDAVIAERTRQEIDAQNRNFAALQQAHREQVAAFDRYNEAWRRRENLQDRSFADFDEVIRGYRTVEDTRTGEHTSVDLGNVHDIVEKLNERDPGRYKEIPLRDEMYPKLPEPKN